MQELAGIENHPMKGQYPCRLPVWWARHGSVHKDPNERGVSGRKIILQIVKNFKKFERWVAKILRAPKILRRPLDQMNSTLWELCDGSRTFAEICVVMNEMYQEEIAPVIARTSVAVSLLSSHNLMVVLEEPLNQRWRVGPGLIPEYHELEISENEAYDLELLAGETP
ncbi:MAG: hypothetical protein L7S56_00500 [Candidatus Poseidonia sp.]|nr:hypothetical protein [Poseidonia sp.]